MHRFSPFTALGAVLLPLSLFLPWFVVAAGEKAGAYSGWLSFERSDRVLGVLGLLALGSAVLGRSRGVAITRLLLGAAAGALVLREMASPPIVDPSTSVGPGAWVGLSGAALVLLGGALALVPLGDRLRPLRERARRIGAHPRLEPLRRLTAALGRLRGDAEPVDGAGAPHPAAGRWVLRGVPSLSPGALGLFRIALALALLRAAQWYSGLPSMATAPEEQQGISWFVRLDPVRALVADPGLLAVAEAVTVVALVLFLVGALSRVSYAVAAAGFLAHALVVVAVEGKAHDWSLPTLALCLLVLVPWQDSGLGVDAVVRRLRGRTLPDAPSRRYGLAVWLPGLAMGTAFAAAAYAKLSIGGARWVTEGAVKYHFVEDSDNALVPWGRWLTSVDEVAVLMALFAVVLEGGFFLVALTNRPFLRLLGGVLVVSLLSGFVLFQGVFWLLWWILLLAFVPWEWVYRGARRALRRSAAAPSASDRGRPLSGPLRVATLAVVAVLVAVQVVVSALALENEPLLSTYPMYSYTWGSEAEFNAGNQELFVRHRFETEGPDGRRVDVTSRVAALDGDDVLVQAAEAEDLEGDEARELEEDLRALQEAYAARHGETLARVRVISEQGAGYDFERGDFDPRVVEREARVVDLGKAEVAAAR